MPTGRFEADFTQFKAEVLAASGYLNTFKGDSDRAAEALAFVAKSGASIAGIRPTTTATTAEVDKLAASAGKATNVFTTLGTGLATADKTLGAFGVHIGPEIHALNELGEIAGKSVSQLGGLGTAVGVAAAAFAGWNIGRKVAELTGADTAIANLTARLLGFGDVARQTAGAKMDVLARASDIAKRSITDFGEAQRIISDQQATFQASLNTSEHRVSLWNAELRKVRTEGHIAALERDIKGHNSTVAELATQYGISERAVEFFTRKLDAAADATKKQEAELQKLLDAQKQFEDKQRALSDSLFGADDLTAATNLAESIGNVVNVQNLSVEAQQRLNGVMTKGIEALVLMNDAANPLTSTFEELRLAASASTRAIEEGLRRDAAAAAEATRQISEMEAAFKASGGTDVEGFKAGFVPTGQSRMQPFVGLKPSVFSAGGVAGVNTPGTMITNHFSVNGTGDDVARIVADKLTRQLSIGGPKFSAVR